MKNRLIIFVFSIILFFLFQDLSAQDSLLVIPVKNLKIEMICVNGGVYTRGCNPDSINNKNCPPRNRPKHQVYVDTFYISKFEVTRALYIAVMNNDPAYNKKSLQNPIENLDWFEVQRFIDTLRKITGLPFRLPTEAEWEYAARGGIYQDSYLYSGSDSLDEVTWHKFDPNRNDKIGNSQDNYYQWTMPVGLKKPNRLGIYDMSGNVSEWCSDWYSDRYYQTKKFFYNPQGPKTGEKRVLRGGSWGQDAFFSSVSFRRGLIPQDYQSIYISIGIRLVISY